MRYAITLTNVFKYCKTNQTKLPLDSIDYLEDYYIRHCGDLDFTLCHKWYDYNIFT